MKKIIYSLAFLITCCTTNAIHAQSKATFYTTMGNFVVDLYDTLQPITTGNFKTLVNAKFYDGIIFHRVINNFMIQGGDPTGTGSGGPGYTIMDEFDPATNNVQKAIAMANSGPNTGGSQFFINLVNNTYLNPNHPVFGMVSSNFTVVQSIGNVATNANDKPLTDVTMDSIRITTAPLAINDKQQADKLLFELYPNPISSQTRIHIQSTSTQTIELSILSPYGSTLYSAPKQLQQGFNAISFHDLNLPHLAAGVYFIVVKDKTSAYQHKITIQ